jgi:predicted ribosome quality control (RQC) complex YloA/Tae2 family protein
VGRHFRLSAKAKVIVGRDEAENNRLLKLLGEDDLCLQVLDFPGPVTLLQGEHSPENVAQAAALAARYSDAKNSPQVKVAYNGSHKQESQLVITSPMKDELLQQVRI